ncbi:MAG: hypothetical protein NVS1B14_03260 [Vulcanimicrobiaceae bacterium]
MVIAAKCSGSLAERADAVRAPAALRGREGASANVFHAAQDGQRPNHLADANPHAEQKNSVRAFATRARF